MKFTEKDLAQIISHGLTPEKVEAQLDQFSKGFGFLPIERAAVAGDGITVLDDKAAAVYRAEFEDNSPGKEIVKFVPASGAATRMFKELFEYVGEGKGNPNIAKLLSEIDRFAFYDVIKERTGGTDKETVEAVLDYGAHLPKALILFHRYAGEVRTALEEHLVEGALYASSNKTVNIHFTISAEHREGFVAVLEKQLGKYERRYGVKFNISFSQQQSGTDTVAVSPQNELFREQDSSLLFRPAGHGALIGNLDNIEADMVFIKNIDNVTTDRLKEDTIKYKKAMGGLLLNLQRKIFNYMNILDRGTDPKALEHIVSFVENELCYRLPPSFASQCDTAKAEALRTILDRPLRICAMVRNEGEPGGGPFWVCNPDGSCSLQIAEPSQVAPEQARLLKEGTHFNPADLVCGMKDHKGEKYDLTQFVDPATGFISDKSKNGRDLRALELPGLWNGAMARWNTVFVEVPVSTFTPVKVVTDLLREEHR